MRLTISRPSKVRTLSGRLGNQSAPPSPPPPLALQSKVAHRVRILRNITKKSSQPDPLPTFN